MRCPGSLAGAILVMLLAWPAPAAAAPPDLTAPGAVLWDPADGRVLHGVAEREGRPMASTTKIMTTLLALEAGTIDETVTVSPAAASQAGASLGLTAGQQVPMRSLLAGLMLRSGNDAAQAVAEHVAGSEAAFVERMNARARELGLADTQFVNPSGLTDDPRHRASPIDLARLTQHARGHPEFVAWARAPRLAVPGLGVLENRNELLGRYPGADGVKTGFTALSRYSLVASATRDGWTLIAVVLGSEDNFGDAADLLDHGFTDFRRAAPIAPAATAARYRWADAAVDLVVDEPLAATVPAVAAVVWQARLQPSVDRPVAEGAVLGHARLVVDGRPGDPVPLRAASPVPSAADRSPGTAAGAAVQHTLRAFLRLHAAERPA